MASSAEEKNISSSAGVLRSFRELSPFTYLLKIQNFPSLAKSIRETCESRLFEAGGYKWKLILYPNGDQKANGDVHISLYLGIEDVSYLPEGWEVLVEAKLFVHNQLQDKYLTFQDGDEIKHFNSSKTKWGFGKLLTLETFNDQKKGYLVDGRCSFGVKVSVQKPKEKWECISIKDMPEDGTFTWRIHKFSALDAEAIYSDEFTAGENKWRLKLFPKGRDEKGNSLSLYVNVPYAARLPKNGRVHARAKLRVLDQSHRNHVEKRIDIWFSNAITFWGFKDTASLRDVRDESKGLLVNDNLIVQVEFEAVSATTYSP